ncbi:hypothetical protein WA171_003060 [Blastocystis sp. BT1]
MQSRFLFSSSEADTLPKTSESISNNFQTYAPNSGPISSNPSSSSLAEEITSRKQIRLDERDHPKQRGDSSSNSYSTDYVFHIAIYKSLSPSEGTTLNCVSTKEDVEYLKSRKVIPSYRFS